MPYLVPFVFAGLFGFAIMILFVGFARSRRAPNPVEERLQMYGTRPRTLEEIELSQPFGERALFPLVRGLARLITRRTPPKNVEEMRQKLELAGLPNNWSVSDFLGVRGLVGIITSAILTFLAVVIRADAPVILLFLGAGGFLGFYLPLFWLNRSIRLRQERILRQLPDAMDLLTISVESGLGFDAAMAKVSEKWDNDLSRAFARTLSEIRVGKSRREALRDMSQRIQISDFTNFIAAIIQADQLGVSIAKVLRIQSEQMRIRRRQRAEELANQAPIKMLIPLTFLVFPSIFIVLLGPAVLVFMSGGFNPR